MRIAVRYRKNAYQSSGGAGEVDPLNLYFRYSDGHLGGRFPAEMPVARIFAAEIFPLRSPPRQYPMVSGDDYSAD